jgi:mRNA-degrading endonuclease toxin of MazEF toxin-antitoxin module
MSGPGRGEVWLAQVGATRLRPCLILSDGARAEGGSLATIIPATRRAGAPRFEIQAPGPEGLPGTDFFDVRSLATISVTHLKQRIGALDRESMAQVEAAVRIWLGL